MRTEGTGHLKFSKDITGNRTRNLLSCGTLRLRPPPKRGKYIWEIVLFNDTNLCQLLLSVRSTAAAFRFYKVPSWWWHGLEKRHHAWFVFSKPCTKLTLHCNHRSGHLKTEHTESLFLLRRHLGNWPRSPVVSTSERTAGSAWETWTVSAADGVRFARVRWEINFLLTFETAPFICKHSV